MPQWDAVEETYGLKMHRAVKVKSAMLLWILQKLVAIEFLPLVLPQFTQGVGVHDQDYNMQIKNKLIFFNNLRYMLLWK